MRLKSVRRSLVEFAFIASLLVRHSHAPPRVSTLDSWRKGKEREHQGQAFVWPEPVDGAALLDELAAVVEIYVSLTSNQASAVALWAAMTWLHEDLEHIRLPARHFSHEALREKFVGG